MKSANVPAIWQPYLVQPTRQQSKRLPRKLRARQVPLKSPKHRKAPKYMDLTRARVAAVVHALVEQGVVVAKHQNIAMFALWTLADDCRTAGVGAGIAIMKSRGK